MILVIDNYDSFVYTLSGYVERLGEAVRVARNDTISVNEIRTLHHTGRIKGIILSPGPCTPNQAGVCLQVVQYLYRHIPILGVCLGHQVIGQAFGATVVQSDSPMHGKTSTIQHTQTGILAGIASPICVARYHSLVITGVPDILNITATTPDGGIMGVAHTHYPTYGVQFHPESILTEYGMNMIQNFIQICNTWGGCDGCVV